MKPTEILMNEHRVIERALKILNIMIEKIEAEESINLDMLERLLDFIQTFADKCHHGKEEKILFPTFEKYGLPKEGGPIGVMLMEHEIGRKYVKMMMVFSKLKFGDKPQIKIFIENGKGYVQLLFQHIMKEDNILFPMGEGLISNEVRIKLMKDFEDLEEREIGKGIHERYYHLIEGLERELGIN